MAGGSFFYVEQGRAKTKSVEVRRQKYNSTSMVRLCGAVYSLVCLASPEFGAGDRVGVALPLGQLHKLALDHDRQTNDRHRERETDRRTWVIYLPFGLQRETAAVS